MANFSHNKPFKLFNIALVIAFFGTVTPVCSSKIDFLLNDQSGSKRKGDSALDQPTELETPKKQKIASPIPLFARAHVDILMLRNFPKYIQKVGLFLAGQPHESLGTDNPSKKEQEKFYNSVGTHLDLDYGLPGPLTQTLRALACQDISEGNLNIYDMPLTVLPAHMTRFKDLTAMTLAKTLIVDIKPIGKLAQLTYLALTDNPITDISALRALQNLTFLDLTSNNIEDIKPLESLFKLKRLTLSHNPIKVLPAFKELQELSTLRVDHTQIKDISDFVKNTPRNGINPLSRNPYRWRIIEIFETPFVNNSQKDPETLEALFILTPVKVVCRNERVTVTALMH